MQHALKQTKNAWIAVLVLALAGCAGASRGDGDGSGGDADADADTDTDAGSSDTDDGVAPGTGCDAMDILFVIDDSASMGCEQEMLAAAFPGFIEVLEQYSNDNADEITYRVGVTSTGRDLSFTLGSYPKELDGLDGELVPAPSSADPWIDGPGNAAQIAADFGAMATLGTEGPFYEMPLECLARAIEKDAPGGANEGFARDGALFIAVIITDEDDCSRDDDGFTIMNDQCWSDPAAHNLVALDDYAALLDERFGGPAGYVVIAIAGEQYCTADSYPTECGGGDDLAGALDAERLEEFVTQTVADGGDGNTLFADICTQDMPTALADALEEIQLACDEYPIE